MFLPSLVGGGAQRAVLYLANAFAELGHRVDLVLCEVRGPYLTEVHEQVRVVGLDGGPVWRGRLGALSADFRAFKSVLRPVLLAPRTDDVIEFLPGMVHYLRTERPDTLLSALTYANLVALWARRLAQVSTRITVSERNTLSVNVSLARKRRKWRWRYLPQMVGRFYPGADNIISVSNGVADDLARCASIPRERIRTIYNPLVTPELRASAATTPEHPWFKESMPPLILGAGKLHEQKDFPTLLRAFARLRSKRKVKLIILGEGKRRPDLLALADGLGIRDDVSLPGFVDNPFAYMARASVFALSSAWEGLPGVLIQALACGCPVVSTDCPSGPDEILENGRYGRLVPVGDDAALAEAMARTLDTPPSSEFLRTRAEAFSTDRVLSQYSDILLPKKL